MQGQGNGYTTNYFRDKSIKFLIFNSFTTMATHDTVNGVVNNPDLHRCVYIHEHHLFIFLLMYVAFDNFYVAKRNKRINYLEEGK